MGPALKSTGPYKTLSVFAYLPARKPPERALRGAL